MNLDLESVFDYGLDRAADLLNRGFADYVVPSPDVRSPSL